MAPQAALLERQHVISEAPFPVAARAGLALACLCAGMAPLAARWLPDGEVRLVYGVVLVSVLLAVAVVTGRVAALSPFRDLAGAFAVLALVQVLNNTLPGPFAATVLHAPPTEGNPLASTVVGSVAVQLFETALALVPIALFAKRAGLDRGAVYALWGSWRWLTLAVGIFAVVYVYTATLPLRPDSPLQRLLPTNGAVSLSQFLTLTPALVVLVVSNGFQEEWLFRGVFLPPYTHMFGPVAANVLQAAIFALAHVGVAYTPNALFFVVAVVFPLGLLVGALMRLSNGVIAPAVVHASLDLPIYLSFLSWVS